MQKSMHTYEIRLVIKKALILRNFGSIMYELLKK